MPFISSIRSVYGPIGRFGRIFGSKDAITGGTISSAGGYRIHTFTDVGTSQFNMSMVPSALNIEYLIIAGGGSGSWTSYQSGGYIGGGGAGGYRTGTISSGPANYPIVVGAGGFNNGSSSWSNGLNSSFNGIVSIGGGSSGAPASGGQSGPTGPEVLPQPGGSGSGSYFAKTAGTGTSGQGYPGGTSTPSGTNGGGGGGAGGTGGNGYDYAGYNFPDQQGVGGAGGAGMSSSINGTSITRASGGGGSGARNNWDTAFPGTYVGPTPGGGGRGFNDTSNIFPPAQYYGAQYWAKVGAPGTGGGGGGGSTNGNEDFRPASGGAWVPGPTTTDAGNVGGSGIVIIRYPYP